MAEEHFCPVTATMSVIGGKWKPIIMWVIGDGTRRFGEMKKIIRGITQKMLTQQLRELETDGVILREVYPVVPPRVDYSLTEYGRTLLPILHVMAQWGESHRASLASQPEERANNAEGIAVTKN